MKLKNPDKHTANPKELDPKLIVYIRAQLSTREQHLKISRFSTKGANPLKKHSILTYIALKG